MPARDGGEGRRDDDALHACVCRSLQHPKRALHRRLDELVLVLRNLVGKRRCDVQDVGTPARGVRPSLIARQIRFDDLEAVAHVDAPLHRLTHLPRAGLAANRAAHAIVLHGRS